MEVMICRCFQTKNSPTILTRPSQGAVVATKFFQLLSVKTFVLDRERIKKCYS